MKKNKLNSGFTLVEILIVVVILGIMAAIVVPKFSGATDEARDSMLRENLRMIRTQLGIYTIQHRDFAPGLDDSDTPSEGAFINHMTLHSNVSGDTNAASSEEFRYGPYMSKIPKNPVNGRSTVAVLAALPDAPPDTDGWIFVPTELVFRADVPGEDNSGQEYYSY